MWCKREIGFVDKGIKDTDGQNVKTSNGLFKIFQVIMWLK